MPAASQDLDGAVTVSLGAKGVVELELVSSGEKWGRGPARTSTRASRRMVDSPAWHLVKALDTLVVGRRQHAAIDGFPTTRVPLSAARRR